MIYQYDLYTYYTAVNMYIAQNTVKTNIITAKWRYNESFFLTPSASNNVH